MKLKAIIADDEPLARERLRSFLALESDIEVVAECGNGTDTVRAVEKERPDLLFLDVQMPRLNGFEVLEALEDGQVPAVIFSTAHDEHAIRAFEFHALDYLLKPCTEERFRKAVQRARETLGQRAGYSGEPQLGALLAQLRTNSTNNGRILVKSPERILFLKPDEIDHVEAAGNYVVLHVGKDRHILRETTAAMEARLSSCGFMRINRSAIINLSRVREVQTVAPGQFAVLLKTGTRLEMTCSLRELQSRLSSL
jgi:two-component system LytT family response regulator